MIFVMVFLNFEARKDKYSTEIIFFYTNYKNDVILCVWFSHFSGQHIEK